jgi:hypothetical protein
MDQTGNKLGTYNWTLGDMEEGDTLLIQYDIASNGPENSTTLTYSASAKGEDPSENEVESRKVSLSLRFLGGIAYAADSSVLGDENSQQAAEPYVLGETSENPDNFPYWIWILSALAYFLAINWALFPKNKTAPKIK